MALTDELVALLGEGAVVTDPSEFGRFEAGWRYGQGRAGAVARPASTEEVSRFLAFCTSRGLRVLPQGANTGLVGASVPDATGAMAVLSLERLNRRLEIDPLDRTARVDAGVLLSTLNGALAPHGLHFPVDLGADPQIGGMVATNTGGSRLLRYGDVRRNLLGIEVVLADGTVVDTLGSLRKNNAGLDWKQLFTGTSGLFGVITGAVVQVAPLPRQRAAALVALADGEAVLRLLRTLERELGEVLTAFEVVSAGALEPVFRHQERLRNPFDALPPYAALVEAGTLLEEARLDLGSLLEETLGTHLEEQGEGVLDARFGRPEDFWALRHHVSESLRQEGRVLAFDIAVPRPSLPAFTRAVGAWLGEAWPCVRVCDFGHWGDGGTHLNLVWADADAGVPAGQLVPLLQEKIYRMAVEDFHGSYSAEHGVGPHNQRFFDAFTPAPVKAAGAALKAHFDPRGLLGTARLW
jgi:FAD/FMN-containing dehydrogenase